MAIKVKIIASEFLNEKMKLPTLGSSNAGAYDVRANIIKPVKIEPNMTAKIPLGFRMQPEDENIHAILIARSGKGHKGLVMSNQIGLIDNDYQGEVCALLYNRNNVQSMVIEPGEAIAQLAFVELPKAEFEIVEAFNEKTERGEDGFGSTDVVINEDDVIPVDVLDDGIIPVDVGIFEEIEDSEELVLVTDLNLKDSVVANLVEAGITNTDKLCELTKDKLLGLAGIGATSVKQIIAALEEFGLELSEEDTWDE